MEDKLNDDRQYVIFRLGTEVFGLDIHKVMEIIVYQESAQMPCVSHLIEGIINLRGHVIPIFNLRRKFNLKEMEKTGDARIMVVEVKDNTVGLVVDKVTEVVMIPGNVVENPSSLISAGIDESFITGVAKMETGLVLLLDLENVVKVELPKVV